MVAFTLAFRTALDSDVPMYVTGLLSIAECEKRNAKSMKKKGPHVMSFSLSFRKCHVFFLILSPAKDTAWPYFFFGYSATVLARFSTWSDTMWYTQMNDEVVYSGFSIQSSSRTSCNTRRTVCCVVCQYSRCTHTNCWGRSIAAEFQRVAAQGAAVSRDRECKHVAES